MIHELTLVYVIIHVLQYLLIFVSNNPAVDCVFMLGHSPLTNVNKHNLWF